jgi:hypothetical protein
MGLSDKLKQLGDKAKTSAAEHREQITGAVESAAVIADKRTKGRYTDKIHRATQKTESLVERLGTDDDGEAAAGAAPAGEPAPAGAPPAPAAPEDPPAAA